MPGAAPDLAASLERGFGDFSWYHTTVDTQVGSREERPSLPLAWRDHSVTNLDVSQLTAHWVDVSWLVVM